MSSRSLSVTVVVTRDDDRFVAQCVEVDVSSFGDTPEEALTMVTEALELWFEDVPFPDHLSRPIVTTVDLHLTA